MYSSQDLKSIRSNKIGLALALSALFFAHASAWTYVPVSDENMVTSADSIIIGVVQEELSSGSIDVGGIYRHYKVQPVEVLKGSGKRSTVDPVIVHINGGIDRAGNRTLHVPGAPSFAPGQNVLLFLDESGFARLSHFALGAFYRISVSNKREAVSVAVRRHEVEDAVQAGLDFTFARDFDQFTGYIRRVISGEEGTEVQNDDQGFLPSATNYVVEGLSPDDLLSALEATEPNGERYNLFTSGGLNPRWKVFDTAGSANWLRHTSGMPGLANGGVQEAIDCMDSWNSNPNSPVNYQLTGTTTNINGLKNSDRLNTILYEDPGNVIAGAYSCRTGGTLAMGGWYSSGTHSFRGASWATIVEGDIVMQDGISCWFTATSNPVASYSNMLTHEMGHTLGLAHSCNTGSTCVAGSDADKAIMRSSAHNNGGRTLQADDIAGIEFLYAPCAPNCPAAGPASPTPAPAVTTRAVTTRAATTARAAATTRAATTSRAAATTARAAATTARAAATTRAITTSRVIAAPTTAALPLPLTTGRRKWWWQGGASEVTGTEETNEDSYDETEESVGLDDMAAEETSNGVSTLACFALVASALVFLL